MELTKSSRNILSAHFTIAGILLAVLALVVSLYGLNHDPVILRMPEGAHLAAEEMMEDIASGDYVSAGQKMYGCPDLGTAPEDSEEAISLIWDAFIDSLEFSFNGDCYASDSGIAQDVHIRRLDVSSITDNLRSRAEAMLTKRVEEADDVSEIYDDENNYRSSVVSEVLIDAVKQAIAIDSAYLESDLTLHMIYEDGQWWVIPDQALLDTISGWNAA